MLAGQVAAPDQVPDHDRAAREPTPQWLTAARALGGGGPYAEDPTTHDRTRTRQT